MKDTKELLKLVKFCKKHGIKRFKSESLELEFSESSKAVPKPRPARSDVPIIVQPQDFDAKMPPENEMLFWSSDFYDQLQAEKQADS